MFTIIITDANCDGFAGTIYKLVNANLEKTSLEQSIINVLRTELSLDSAMQYCLIPLKLTGGIFTEVEKRQSSTYRERLAMLRILDEFHQYIDTPCIMISDNQNCRLTWKNVDEFLTHAGELNRGSLFTSWIRFISLVHKIIWVPRNSSEITLVDDLARAITKRQPTKVLNVNSIDSRQADNNEAHVNDQNGDSQSEPHESIEMMQRLPHVSLPVREALQRAYMSDTTTYMNIRMSEVYGYLVHGTKVSDRVKHLASRFVVKDDLVYHIRTVGTPQIYVPTGGSVQLHELEHTGFAGRVTEFANSREKDVLLCD